jgi:AcrR family transcriptional regulator
MVKAQAKPSRRQARTPEDREARMQAIRAAALNVFSEKGFSAARIDDVAAAAGIAKGTVYLYFASKDELLEAIVGKTIGATLAQVEQAVTASPLPALEKLRLISRAIIAALGDSDRRRVLHIVLSEGGRFPAIADFYHREIIARAMRLLRAVLAQGQRDGEFVADELARFPQLFIAPALVAAIWAVVFGRIEPLDAGAMLEAHFDLLLRDLARSKPGIPT